MKLNKTWVNKTGSLTFEVRECIDKNLLSYRYYVITEDGNETLKGRAGTRATAIKWLKREYDIEGMFKEKKKKRKRIKATKVEYDGYKFDSISEREFYIYLQNNKAVTNIKVHPRFELQKGYTMTSIADDAKDGIKKVRPITFSPDFVCEVFDIPKAFDVKGSKRAINETFPLRRKLFEKTYCMECLVAIYNEKSKEWELS
ncbi:DUF1064 domain-containing protein [Bacillus sp. COPE52]|uniref:DUF1064 domain-containing protein n=1 Tax=Bacillus sp. COPE52 TaxID=2233998 RepID=UPI000E100FFA|nr:DUF1064 domain-containing protein [Bacillus sp. COPE52]AXK19142.1 DUF1064 domain-containing protein [Bacillus sp. COPE52]